MTSDFKVVTKFYPDNFLDIHVAIYTRFRFYKLSLAEKFVENLLEKFSKLYGNIISKELDQSSLKIHNGLISEYEGKYTFFKDNKNLLVELKNPDFNKYYDELSVNGEIKDEESIALAIDLIFKVKDYIESGEYKTDRKKEENENKTLTVYIDNKNKESILKWIDI